VHVWAKNVELSISSLSHMDSFERKIADRSSSRRAVESHSSTLLQPRLLTNKPRVREKATLAE
jgi:hypothetical protein